MKFLPLILANLFRKKVRTTLTVGSFAVALFLFGVLVAIRGAFNQGIDVAGVDRLAVRNKVSLLVFVPYSYKERMRQVRGVKDVTFATWFGGVYQDERNFFPQFAIDLDTYRGMFPEFLIPDEQWRDFAQDRQGAIAGEGLAERFKWKLGERIPLRGTIFPGQWEFNLRGIYKGARPQDDTSQFWFRYDYLEENGPRWVKGQVGWYTVRVQNAPDAAKVVSAIDATFANSDAETYTDTEKAFAASFVKQMGNIEFLILGIGSVVFFTLLLVTGNTMAIAVRERVGELAVLKTLGFSDRFVLGLVLTESILVAAIGGGLGVTLAKLFTLGGSPAPMIIPTFYLPLSTIALGFLYALLMGTAAGALPAISASRLRIVEALRRV
jgi:putative ABC transport system permease protein